MRQRQQHQVCRVASGQCVFRPVAVQLFVILGIIGEYIAILFAELKDRPIYIVRDIYEGKKEDR